MSQASSGPLGRAPASSESGEAKPDTDPALTDVLDCLLRFGTAMMRAGDTAFRVREWTGAIARAMGVEALSVRLALGGITASARRGSEHATLTREIAPPGIDAWRLGALENLARDVRPGLMPADLAAKLAAIEAQPPLYSLWQTAAAVGAASGAFSYLNGGGALEVFAAVAGGGIGQLLRSLLLRRRLNQYAVTALCAVIASGVYCAIAAAAMRAGFGTLRDAAGFISSVLFLVPGFPFVAALLDLLQHQGLAGITRLAYGTMLLLAAAFGLTIVAATAGLSTTPASPLPLGEPLTLLLRAQEQPRRSSFGPRQSGLGVLALVGNELRLALNDAGMTLAPATFLGAFAVGLLASLARPRLHEPRIALTVPGIIIMVPGTYAFQTVVLFDQGDTLAAMQAAVLGGFVVGAMALGLAAARFASDRGWVFET